jgi:N4-(beta-N-acetylglucosaminyl)-L-asparaginase
MDTLNRRGVLAAGAAAALAGIARAQPGQPQPAPAKPAEGKYPGDNHRGPCSVSSLNGLRAVARAMELSKQGYDPADCIVQGVRIIEDDPNDTSVGLGGEPNEDGVVELDASVMHGPTHKTGAVAALHNIKNPAMVALLVLRRTDHCLLVGEGALKFAKEYGFQEENLLTEQSRLEWLKWKSSLGKDARLNDDELDPPAGKVWEEGGSTSQRRSSIERSPVTAYMEHTGTVHCSIVNANSDIASCTSTSGLSWKIPGRVGDSPIIGAGNYCDNAVGAAGSTGRGEANIVNLCSFFIVECMSRGMGPTEACLAAAKRVAEHTREKRLRTTDGKPNFDLKFYALRKDGAYGGASMFPGGKFAVDDGTGAKAVDAPSLFDKR